jgi:hypothetical protein
MDHNGSIYLGLGSALYEISHNMKITTLNQPRFTEWSLLFPIQFLGPALWRLSPAPLFASSPVELMPTARSYTAFCSNFLAFFCINWGTILQLFSTL